MDFGKRRQVRHVTLSRQTQQPRQAAVTSSSRRRRGATPLKMALILVPLLIISGVVGAGIALGWKIQTAVKTIVVANENTGILYDGGSGDTDTTPIMQWEQSDERINILMLGLDRRSWEKPENSRTDTIMLLSINPQDNSMVMFSIPRDLQVTYTDENGRSSLVKINAVHVYGYDGQDKASGPKAMKKAVSELLGVNVHYFVRLDFDGFEQAIDEVGGVTINVQYPLVPTKDGYPDDAYGYRTFNIQPGEQVMDGDTALIYARARHVVDARQQGDQNRARRQQEVMVAFKEKLIASKWDIITNPSKLSDLLDTMKDNLLTDIQLEEMIQLASKAKDIDTNNPNKVSSVVLSSPYIYHEDRTGVDWRYYLRDTSMEELHAYVAELFSNPFLQQQLQDEAAMIRLENGTMQSGFAIQTQNYLSQNYNLVFQSAANADRTDYQQVVIYDMSNGQYPVTLGFLEKFFNTSATTPEVLYPGEEADIVVVVGSNFQIPSN
jgi:LCP family protein required for cell wall assembly